MWCVELQLGKLDGVTVRVMSLGSLEDAWRVTGARGELQVILRATQFRYAFSRQAKRTSAEHLGMAIGLDEQG